MSRKLLTTAAKAAILTKWRSEGYAIMSRNIRHINFELLEKRIDYIANDYKQPYPRAFLETLRFKHNPHIHGGVHLDMICDFIDNRPDLLWETVDPVLEELNGGKSAREGIWRKVVLKVWSIQYVRRYGHIYHTSLAFGDWLTHFEFQKPQPGGCSVKRLTENTGLFRKGNMFSLSNIEDDRFYINCSRPKTQAAVWMHRIENHAVEGYPHGLPVVIKTGLEVYISEDAAYDAQCLNVHKAYCDQLVNWNEGFFSSLESGAFDEAQILKRCQEFGLILDSATKKVEKFDKFDVWRSVIEPIIPCWAAVESSIIDHAPPATRAEKIKILRYRAGRIISDLIKELKLQRVPIEGAQAKRQLEPSEDTHYLTYHKRKNLVQISDTGKTLLGFCDPTSLSFEDIPKAEYGIPPFGTLPEDVQYVTQSEYRTIRAFELDKSIHPIDRRRVPEYQLRSDPVLEEGLAFIGPEFYPQDDSLAKSDDIRFIGEKTFYFNATGTELKTIVQNYFKQMRDNDTADYSWQYNNCQTFAGYVLRELNTVRLSDSDDGPGLTLQELKNKETGGLEKVDQLVPKYPNAEAVPVYRYNPMAEVTNLVLGRNLQYSLLSAQLRDPGNVPPAADVEALLESEGSELLSASHT